MGAIIKKHRKIFRTQKRDRTTEVTNAAKNKQKLIEQNWFSSKRNSTVTKSKH